MTRQFLTKLASGLAATALLAGTGSAQSVAPRQPPAAGTAPQGQVIDGIVALVNGELISQWDVRNRMVMILMSFGRQPDKQIQAAAQREAIEQLIDERIQLQEFTELAKGQTIEDEEVDQEIAFLAQQNKMTAEQFAQSFTQSGANIQTLRDQIKANIAWKALIGGRYGKSVRVSENRIDETLGRLKDSLDEPQYRIAEIFLFAPDQASKEKARTTAEALIAEINKGADFKSIARQFSSAPSAAQGGDLQLVRPGDLRPEVEAAVLKAPEPPALLPPIDSESGIYVVAVLGKRDPSQAPPATLNLKQVSASGDSAAALLQQVKSKAKTCAEVAAAVKDIQGVASADMNEISLGQLQGAYRSALEPLEAGASSDILDLPENQKMVFYVCERSAGGNQVPSRQEIRGALLDGEIAMIRERYLRDLKREATIERR